MSHFSIIISMLHNLFFQHTSFLVAYRHIKRNICTQQKEKYIPSLLVTSEICSYTILLTVLFTRSFTSLSSKRGHALHIVCHSKVKSEWDSLHGVSYQWYTAWLILSLEDTVSQQDLSKRNLPPTPPHLVYELTFQWTTGTRTDMTIFSVFKFFSYYTMCA
jgi:hypothetical protein